MEFLLTFIGQCMNVRLTSEEVAAIKSSVKLFDPMAKVYLFGSRCDLSKAGGDIDLLVESHTIAFGEKINILIEIKKLIGEQKIDLVVSKNILSDPDPFIKIAAKGAVLL